MSLSDQNNFSKIAQLAAIIKHLGSAMGLSGSPWSHQDSPIGSGNQGWDAAELFLRIPQHLRDDPAARELAEKMCHSIVIGHRHE